MLTSQPRSHTFTQLQTTHSGHWQFRHVAATDTGRKRPANEDYFLLYPDRRLFVIADGMGGHAAGDVASELAGKTVAAYFDEADLPRAPSPSASREDSITNHLVQAVKIANSTVFEKGKESAERQGMGTTLVMLSFDEELAYWANVGDSRLYRFRNRQLEQLTRDHSLLEDTLERQNVTGPEAERLKAEFPYKNVLTRAIGSQYVVDVDTDSVTVEDGDLFVMTTDGVHDVVDDDTLRNILVNHHDDWRAACGAVIAEANNAGGPDNITIVCVEAHRS